MAFGLDELDSLQEYMPSKDEDIGHFSQEECNLILQRMGKMLGFEVGEPKKNCKKCHGRGYIGYDHQSGFPIACNCIMKNATIINPFDVGEKKSAQREARDSQK